MAVVRDYYYKEFLFAGILLLVVAIMMFIGHHSADAYTHSETITIAIILTVVAGGAILYGLFFMGRYVYQRSQANFESSDLEITKKKLQKVEEELKEREERAKKEKESTTFYVPETYGSRNQRDWY